jgi:hypothetical protein
MRFATLDTTLILTDGFVHALLFDGVDFLSANTLSSFVNPLTPAFSSMPSAIARRRSGVIPPSSQFNRV